MMGDKDNPGLMPMVCEGLFYFIEAHGDGTKYNVMGEACRPRGQTMGRSRVDVYLGLTSISRCTTRRFRTCLIPALGLRGPENTPRWDLTWRG